MSAVYEFGEWFEVTGDRLRLESYLHDVWLRNKPDDEEPVSDIATVKTGFKQGFLNFDGDKARARNYIGFVQISDFHLEVYPKVFKHLPDNAVNSSLILKHLFFWFDYCRKWKFPFTNVQLDNQNCNNWPELIINLMASQILEVIATNPLMQYQETEETLFSPRGRINFSRYLARGLSNGNMHQLECDYEPLVYDNQLNRVIKYVARQLKHKTKFAESHQKLEDILFILDEVTDEPCTAASLRKIKLNTFFEAYTPVIQMCKFVLDQEIYNHQQEDQSHWSLLFPMEYIFEDFIAGFIEAELANEWKIEYQKSDMFLTDEPNVAFQMRHDIILSPIGKPETKLILDTKYKLRPETEGDPKKGIAQSDMYQMIAYSLRRGCKEVILLYPNFRETCKPPSTFLVSSGFNKAHQIHITAAEIPFWSMVGFDQLKIELSASLKQLLNKYRDSCPISRGDLLG